MNAKGFIPIQTGHLCFHLFNYCWVFHSPWPSLICTGLAYHLLLMVKSLILHDARIPPSATSAIAYLRRFSSVQFTSVAQSCPTLCGPMNRSMPGLPVHHQLPEFTQIHVHRVSVAIQPSHPLLSPSPPAPNPSQHQSLFQWVNSSHQVAKLLEFKL